MGVYDKQPCPYCGAKCEADFVDVGVGWVQCGPYHCECGASEIGAWDSPRPLTSQEKKTGWYAPGEPLSDKANTIKGEIVDIQTAKYAYQMGSLDKPKEPKKVKALCKPCNVEFCPQFMIDQCPNCKQRTCFDEEVTITYDDHQQEAEPAQEKQAAKGPLSHSPGTKSHGVVQRKEESE